MAIGFHTHTELSRIGDGEQGVPRPGPTRA